MKDGLGMTSPVNRYVVWDGTQDCTEWRALIHIGYAVEERSPVGVYNKGNLIGFWATKFGAESVLLPGEKLYISRRLFGDTI